ncbi:hypothetical protein [Inquilinus limosus]|uniref:Uncharacterized protein n=1 Tax=Inquilinus limosus TaxID=171674 RepID=A0A211ZSC5_9PROT|nr:hypothetical protein [Inquilinus limosus]OWJ68188.1 hypothetical protein BWR60_05810 [Inquilinus limosus]
MERWAASALGSDQRPGAGASPNRCPGCGFATLALAAVLGFSLAGNAPDAGEPIRIVAQPAAAEVVADAGPFDTASCATLVTARR